MSSTQDARVTPHTTAFVRTREGSRHCPRGVDIVRFLAEAMRSIASDALKLQKRKPELQLVPKVGGGDAFEFDIPADAPNVEDIIASGQEVERIFDDEGMLEEDSYRR